MRVRPYNLELEINQPRALVVELFGNSENLGAWQPGYLGMEFIEGEPGAVGARACLKYAHGRREIEMAETILANDLPAEFSSLYEAPGMTMTVRHRFEDLGEGTTRWRSENEAEVRGMMMKFISLLMPGCFRKQSLKYMENFKAFAEEGQDLRNREES